MASELRLDLEIRGGWRWHLVKWLLHVLPERPRMFLTEWSLRHARYRVGGGEWKYLPVPSRRS